MTAEELSKTIKSTSSSVPNTNAEFSRLLIDSRSLSSAQETLFFAIPTKRNTGGHYVENLYAKGVMNFIVSDSEPEEVQQSFDRCSGANIWRVKNVVSALQQLAGARRKTSAATVVGITGSNGKTIVKDWLAQLLNDDYNLVASPKSYNSQIGVPLSLWQIDANTDMAIIEVGISETGEMDNLRSIVDPKIGIFTNIGQAHDENFLSRTQKITEKLLLFTHCEVLIYCLDHKDIHSVITSKEVFRNKRLFTWGHDADSSVRLIDTVVANRKTTLVVEYEGKTSQYVIPFIDKASAENVMHCITLLFYLGYDAETIAHRCASLSSVAMRLEMIEGINSCLLVNDSYSLDINSLSIALDYVQHEQQYHKKTLIMSDFEQAGMPAHELYSIVANEIKEKGISSFIGIGTALCSNKEQFASIDATFYESTEEFLNLHPLNDFSTETILLKGARKFHFEHIAKVLQHKTHETVLEVNLDALVHNLNYYRSKLKPTTKLMAMVKASSYGAGTVEIANALQFNRVDYLTVAYCDEGVELRRNGITLPIMVMNPEEQSFNDMIHYHLEPDVYSFRVLKAFEDVASMFCASGEKIDIHIELDTGMHRLGFSGEDMEAVAAELNKENCPFKLKSIFSHLACSEDSAMDDFTRGQIERFHSWSSKLKKLLNDESICCHILNSSGITRFPEAQMDMVRLGIGLYGISPEEAVQREIKPISSLHTKISQIKTIEKGDSVGYNRRWVAKQRSKVAIIPIGYADGFSRMLGYENSFVSVNHKRVPVIGSVCMDMCFIDVTGVECQEGDDVIIFDSPDSIAQLAKAANTIPYEILTSVAQRVKRVYYKE